MVHSLFSVALVSALLPGLMYHTAPSLVAASPETSCWTATAPDMISASQCLPTGSVSRPVTVGVAGSLGFSPSGVDANIGDVIEFTFLKLNHTLTQSTLWHPCSNMGGFSTGFNQFNPTNDSAKFMVKYLVTTSEPQCFFCAQTERKSHCQAGMVFALNAGDEMSAFQSAASVTSSTEQSSTSTTLTSLSVGQPDVPPTSPADSITSSITEQPSSSASQTVSPTPKYQNLTNQTSPRTATAVPTSLTPTASMGIKGEIAAMISLALLSVMMLIFMSL